MNSLVVPDLILYGMAVLAFDEILRQLRKAICEVAYG